MSRSHIPRLTNLQRAFRVISTLFMIDTTEKPTSAPAAAQTSARSSPCVALMSFSALLLELASPGYSRSCSFTTSLFWRFRLRCSDWVRARFSPICAASGCRAGRLATGRGSVRPTHVHRRRAGDRPSYRGLADLTGPTSGADRAVPGVGGSVFRNRTAVLGRLRAPSAVSRSSTAPTCWAARWPAWRWSRC